MSSEAIQTLQSTFENEYTDNSSVPMMDLETFAEEVLNCVEGKHIYEVLPYIYTDVCIYRTSGLVSNSYSFPFDFLSYTHMNPYA